MHRINHAIPIATITNNVTQSLLKDGSSVFVKIINSSGNNQYSASIGNTFFTLQSSKELTPNSVFKAIIEVKNNQILLHQILDNTKNENSVKYLSQKDFLQSPTSVNNYLQNLGLEQNSLSFRLIQLIQQLQIKIDIPQIKKSVYKSKSVDTKNKKEDFAEADFFLSDKNIHASDTQIVDFIDNILQDNSNSNQNTQDENDTEDNSFLSSIYSNSNTLSTLKPGVLTLSNHIKSPNTDLHWIFLPYFLEFQDIKYNGCIRLLLNTSQKKLQKMYINCESSLNKFYFMLYYKVTNRSNQNTIKFYTEPEVSLEKIENMKKQLQQLLTETDKNFIVQYSLEAKIEGLLTEDQPIPNIRVQV